MAYQALYRKYRPLSFDDVIGQGHIVSTLKNEIATGKTAHAYLFCGTRGTGKTSCAKIFARAVNCLNPKDANPCNECEICKGALDGSILDIVEIDAASNNGVDNIREIREEVSYSAAQAKYKIYIIDEVHMLSGGAFNALLKTLEEPPAHVIFILATTEAHKLPTTITSRCQRFDFKRISVRDILVRLREVVTLENIDITMEALELIARLSDGAMRDALSILDRCIGACGDRQVTLEEARSVLSIASDELVEDTVNAIYKKDNAAIISVVAEVVQSGKDINNFIELLLQRFRDILVCKVSKNVDGIFEYANDTIEKIQKAVALFDAPRLSYIIETLCGASADAKWQKNARTLYELALMRLCDDRLSISNSAILARLEKLENMVKNGDVVIDDKNKADVVIELPEKDNEHSDIPPWETEKPVSFDKVQKIEVEGNKEEALVKKEESVRAEEQVPPYSTESVKISPTPIQSIKKQNAPTNVWGELLGVLQKKYPPLYGALAVKKAKFDGEKLYIKNESYVKQIITMFKDDFDAALASVAENVRLSFVTEEEYNMIGDSIDGIQNNNTFAAGTAGKVIKPMEEKDIFPTEETESIKELLKDEDAFSERENVSTTEQEFDTDMDEEDPLDALLNLGNADIIIEE